MQITNNKPDQIKTFFNLDLKMGRVGAVLISIGRLFQSLGAATANAQSPLDLSLVGSRNH